MDSIRIRGARTHNLQSINLDIPRDRLIVITGVSGSGKSSLAFDTIYAEGQRRYVESLSAYARQFLSVMEKPDADHIEGLSPAISIDQKATSHNPRSTVGTVTEVYDYLRLLYARVGDPRCPRHGISLTAQTVSQMVDSVLALPDKARCLLLAPVVRGRKGEHAQVLQRLRGEGLVRVRIDGRLMELDQDIELAPRRQHDIEAVIDRFRVRPDMAQRLAESFETALRLAGGLAKVVVTDDDGAAREELLFSSRYACPHCGYSLSELEPKMFSFNNPAGACPECHGVGHVSFFDPKRIVVDPGLSLPAGAISGWDRHYPYCMSLIQGLADHYGFDPDAEFKKLPKKMREIILHGSGEEKIRFDITGRYGGGARTRPFEGVIPAMQRRYKGDDPMAREKLARYLSTSDCPDCGGSRLSESARHVLIDGHSLPDLTSLSIDRCLSELKGLKLTGQRRRIADRIFREACLRLNFLVDVGLSYLTLNRRAETLSGGEAQRIRLASQIGAGLVGVTYVLDEPSIGLHQRDNKRLLSSLSRLRDIGNTVIVVEHDQEAIESADQVIDLGPGAGCLGGYVVSQGTPAEVAASTDSLTGQYLSGKIAIAVPSKRIAPDGRWLKVIGAGGNNLKKVDVSIPMGLMVCVTGVSGSGKSTLINDTVYRLVASHLLPTQIQAAPYKRVDGLSHIDKVVDIDQSPIGRTPRSNPATYTGLFSPVRELFAGLPESRTRGYTVGRFSFNVRGGRCEACEGDGMIRVEMHFLPDIHVPCDVCQGRRYNRETLDVRYKGRTIHEVLDMSVAEACEFFSVIPAVNRRLQTLRRVGLDYIRLGQMATTLSGGEAQRIKLSRELSRRDTGNTLYILDEPTTGLHFHDIAQLLSVLHELRDRGNTVVIIEHNLDVIKTADYIIDLGPEGGDGGGRVIATGTPEQVAACPDSYTGQFLAAMDGIVPAAPAVRSGAARSPSGKKRAVGI